jgi:DNA-binding NtrC family response regulator
MKALKAYNWTGNIRELRNVVERLAIMSDSIISQKEVEKYL